MSSHAHPARRRVPSEVVVAPLIVAVAFAFGGVYAYSADRLSPWIVPGIVAAGLAAAGAYRRPEIGVAFALIIIPAATLGLDHHLATYFVEAWSVYLVVVAYWRRHGRVEARRAAMPPLGVLVIVYIAIALVSVTQTSDLHAASQLLRSLATGGLLFAATVLAVRGRREIVWVLAGAAGGALIVGLQATRDYLTGGSPTTGFITSSGELVGRVSAGFSQPNQLGGFLVVLVPLAIGGALLARRGRAGFAVAALFAAVGVYASFSRGALIGLALVPFLFLRGRRLFVLGPLIVLLVAVSVPGLVRERFATLSLSGNDVATRVDIWRVAANIWENHPVVGVGIGGFPQAYTDASLPGKTFLPSTVFEPPPHAHNVFLQLLAEEGILGLLAFLAILTVAVRIILRLRGSGDREARLLGCALLAALMAFLIHNQFDVTLEDPQTGLYIFVLLGLIVAGGRVYRVGGPGPSDRLPVAPTGAGPQPTASA